MNATLKMVWVELKLLTRNPIAVGFTIFFPVLLLFVFGSIWGNQPDPQLDGHGMIDTMVPAYLALIIATTGLMSLPTSLAVRREQGVLRRFRATPLRPAVVLGSQVIVNLILAIVGTLLLIIIGRLVYNLQLPADMLAVTVAFLVSGLSFFALSFVVASLARTGDAARSIGMALFFPMLMLSGASLPRFLMPAVVQNVTGWLPMTLVVTLLQNLWFGLGWNAIALAALGGILLVGTIISLRTFRWE